MRLFTPVLRLDRKVSLLVSLCVGVFFIVVSPVYGVTSDFTVRTFVGEDTTPPTVPGSLTATPVATTQINLAWSTSTDDVLFSGYQVFRDDVQIGTTTLTNYSDSGLLESTLYTYYVTAFDEAGNVSASSSVVATTTLTTPPTPPPTPDDGVVYGSRGGSNMVRLEVIPGERDARIQYETDTYIRGVMRWGETVNYELGTSREELFSKVHRARIDGLRPDTVYRFRLEGIDGRGRFVVLHEGTFRTLSTIDVTPPGIVDPFTLTADGDTVMLAWENPGDTDFDHVRVVRNSTFYPRDEADGWVVYEGKGTEGRDEHILREHETLYYSIFAYDAQGNISAGAVRSISRGEPVMPPVPPIRDNPIFLTFEDFQFFQDGQPVAVENGMVALDGARHFTIALPYERLPEHLKTIFIRIVPDDAPESELAFVLRVNGDKTFYTARLAPLGITGNFRLFASVFDYKTQQQGFAEGVLTVAFQHDRVIHDSANDGHMAQFELWHIVSFLLILVSLAYVTFRILRDTKTERHSP